MSNKTNKAIKLSAISLAVLCTFHAYADEPTQKKSDGELVEINDTRFSSGTAVTIDARDVVVRVGESGMVDGDKTGILADDQDSDSEVNVATVRNFGSVYSADTAIEQHVGEMEIENLGIIFGDNYGVRRVSDERLTIENTGLIGADVHGIRLDSGRGGDLALISNAGDIEGGESAIRQTGGTARVINDGALVGEEYAVDVNGDSTLIIDNRDLILGETMALRVRDGSELELVNTGDIFGGATGKAILVENQATIDNDGLIDGDVSVDGRLNLTLRDGSVITGDVSAGDDSSLRLAGGRASRMIHDGEQFSGFEDLLVDGASNASYDLIGEHTHERVVLNNGHTRLVGEGASITVQEQVSVERDARLSGTGSIDGDLVAHGRVAPGNSPGKLRIKGDVTLEEGASLEFYVGEDGTSLLKVDGLLNVNDNLVVLQNGSGFLLPHESEIVLIEAGSIEGELGGLTASGVEENGEAFPFLVMSLTHQDNGSTHAVVLGYYEDPEADLAAVAQNDRQAAAARLIQNADRGSDDPLHNAVIMAATEAEAQGWYELASGAIYPNVALGALESSRLIRQTMMSQNTDRYRQAVISKGNVGFRNWHRRNVQNRAGIWVRPIVSGTQTVADHQGLEVEQSSRGLALGGEWGSDRGHRFGFGVGQLRHSVDSSHGDVDGDHIFLSAYWRYAPSAWDFSLTGAYGKFSYDVDRPGPGGTMSGDVDGESFSVVAEAGYTARFGEALVRPSLGVTYDRVSVDSTRESGHEAGALAIDSYDASVASARVGLDLSRPIATENGSLITPYVGFAYEADFDTEDPEAKARFRNGDGNASNSVVFVGDEVNTGRAEVRAGVDWQVRPLMNVGVDYRYDEESTVSVGLRLRF